MNGKKVLLYSNVLINASKGDKNALSIIKNESNELYISIITYVEVLGFEFRSKREEGIVKEILELIEVINLDMEIAEQAIKYRKLKKIKLPDAFILATAKKLTLILHTFDLEDYNIVDNSVEVVKLKN